MELNKPPPRPQSLLILFVEVSSTLLVQNGPQSEVLPTTVSGSETVLPSLAANATAVSLAKVPLPDDVPVARVFASLRDRLNSGQILDLPRQQVGVVADDLRSEQQIVIASLVPPPGVSTDVAGQHSTPPTGGEQDKQVQVQVSSEQQNSDCSTQVRHLEIVEKPTVSLVFNMDQRTQFTTDSDRAVSGQYLQVDNSFGVLDELDDDNVARRGRIIVPPAARHGSPRAIQNDIRDFIRWNGVEAIRSAVMTLNSMTLNSMAPPYIPISSNEQEESDDDVSEDEDIIVPFSQKDDLLHRSASADDLPVSLASREEDVCQKSVFEHLDLHSCTYDLRPREVKLTPRRGRRR